ncbi:MAG: hypothetical protein QW705_03680 [Zestosphaera sp.]
MLGAEGCWPPTYIATVEYGREEFAENELGDSFFYLDPGIKVCRTRYGGVLLIKTTVTDEELAVRLLTVAVPSSLRRLMKVLFCCGVNDLVPCINANVEKLSGFSASSLRVGERSGITRRFIRELLGVVGDRVSGNGSGGILSVEPLEDSVCFARQVFSHIPHHDGL